MLDENQPPEFRRFAFADANRKFEIELLWKRSAFFWGFIAIVFAGYTLTLEESPALSLVLSSFGGVSSVCWYMANSASSFWQKVWERNLMAEQAKVLEKDVYDDIPKVSDLGEDSLLCSWRRFSLSGLTTAFSLYVTILWVSLCVPPLLLMAKELRNLELLPWLAVAWFAFSAGFAIVTIKTTMTHSSIPNTSP